MSISAVTSPDETTRPNTGVLALAVTRANGAGNMPSSAAASGTRPWSRIQPLSAPNVETIATSGDDLVPAATEDLAGCVGERARRCRELIGGEDAHDRGGGEQVEEGRQDRCR